MRVDTSGEHRVAILDWCDIEDYVAVLTCSIRESGPVPDVIVAVLRGGCVPAVWLAHALGITNFLAVQARTTVNDLIRSARNDVIRIDNMPNLKSYSSVLIVDDVTNSGRTLRTVRGNLDLESPSVATAALVWDTLGHEGEDCAADYVALEIAAWISFPWERSVHAERSQP